MTAEGYLVAFAVGILCGAAGYVWGRWFSDKEIIAAATKDETKAVVTETKDAAAINAQVDAAIAAIPNETPEQVIARLEHLP